MRLIDADNLILDIRKRPYINKALSEIFETIIDAQPTAYDVDKVVEQIKSMSPANYVSKDDVLKIVKGGGVEVVI